MGYRDKEKQKQANIEYRMKRVDFWRRILGPCVSCGSPEIRLGRNYERTKQIKSCNIEDAWERLKHKTVLCTPCYMLAKATNNPSCGTTNKYRRGCRCGKCRAARSAYGRAKTAERKALGMTRRQHMIQKNTGTNPLAMTIDEIEKLDEQQKA